MIKLGIENIDLPGSSLIEDNISQLHNDLNKKIEEHIIEGLRRKGIEFKTKLELEEFAKDRCRCEEDYYLGERVYYVDNIPFLLIDSKIERISMKSTVDGKYHVNANLVTYNYL